MTRRRCPPCLRRNPSSRRRSERTRGHAGEAPGVWAPRARHVGPRGRCRRRDAGRSLRAGRERPCARDARRGRPEGDPVRVELMDDLVDVRWWPEKEPHDKVMRRARAIAADQQWRRAQDELHLHLYSESEWRGVYGIDRRRATRPTIDTKKNRL